MERFQLNDLLNVLIYQTPVYINNAILNSDLDIKIGALKINKYIIYFLLIHFRPTISSVKSLKNTIKNCTNC